MTKTEPRIILDSSRGEILSVSEFLFNEVDCLRSIDFVRGRDTITAVRRIAALSAVAALIFATFYAPFFHVHVDTHGGALVHAHLPELETAEDESVVHMERPHSHAAARSIDFLTTTAAPSIHVDAVMVTSQFVEQVLFPSCGFVARATPNAHSPPPLTFQIPRAPPA